MNSRIIIWLLAALIVGVGAMLRFSTSHEEMPIGCDEFGYLNLARTLNNEAFYKNEANTLLEPLVDTLRSEGITDNEIIWMIAPHAYHLVADKNVIINQYPPGTSFVLKFIPINFRKIVFPFLVFLFLIILVVVAINYSGNTDYSLFDWLFIIFIFISTVSSPFLTELTRINSLALTFGMLIAAGIILDKKPLLSLLLIALTVNFRTANIVMLLPVYFFLISSLKGFISTKPILKFGGIALAGILPLLIYQYLVLGNPFRTTYSQIDQAIGTLPNVINSIKYYFDFSQQWFVVHLIFILILILLCLIKKSDWKIFILTLLFPIFNYMFFIVHKVHMDYYPYASALILFGVILNIVSKIKMDKKATMIIISCFSIYILLAGIVKYNKRDHITYEMAAAKYNVLCDYDIVWADLYSGTSEYVCNNYGFRFGTTTPRARAIAIKYLHNQHYKQLVLLDDNPVSKEQIVEEIKAMKLSYGYILDETVGSCLVIPAE